MYAVGRLGSYITRGVYTVSGPFHPFGGAVDIVVVEQQDGSFKSSPWYVRFGKFQGVLKAKEKIININVNGLEANFPMYLDQRGEAYFLREMDSEEVDAVLSPSSSGEELDKCPNNRPLKTKSLNLDFDQLDSVAQIDASNRKALSRTHSRRSRILGFVLGRRSMKEGSFRAVKDESEVGRADSLERAEIAADLLEMKWSTNLYRKRKDNVSHLSAPDILNDEARTDGLISDGQVVADSLLHEELCVNSLENPVLGDACFDGNNEPVIETLHSKGEGGEVSMHVETLHETIELVPEVKSQTETGLEAEPLNTNGMVGDGKSCDFYNDANIVEGTENTIVAERYTEAISIHPVNGSGEVDKMNGIQPPFEPLAEFQEVADKFVATKETPETVEEEEQFIFSDLEVENTEFIPIDHVKKDNQHSLESKAVEAGSESFSSSYESDSCQGKFVRESLPIDIGGLTGETGKSPSHVDIPECQVTGVEVGRLGTSLPDMWTQFDEFDANHHRNSLAHSLDSVPKSSKWKLLRKDVSRIIKLDMKKENLSSTSDSPISEELKDESGSVAVGDPSNIVDVSSGSWRLWPFRRSRSRRFPQPPSSKKGSDAESVLESQRSMDAEKEVSPRKANKMKIKILTPTSEQLAALNLKEGQNTVTFTFSTAMLGPQQVDARIFLWRWDTRIVISDVDGTITKSDVLGQFMPLVGRDWSQTGVAHLFSAIKENGYQMLFLSARAISQAYHTRQFLFNLKQDGKALPDGPVVISPDGLFPSLFREVIRRAPHEFKIACLEDIRALFPSDRNPFYAGFGNRDTDELSYLKVGIPKGKIFIINPKGEVVVNRCVDSKSYTSLHVLVNGMFPPVSSHEEEDYNSWNFWKLPPPTFDI